MPYQNEHSARLRNPKDFDKNPVWKDGKPGQYRRTDDGKLYAKIKVPQTVSIIWGKLKGKAGLKDPVVPQSLRFAEESWTVEKSKKWLKDNNVKYISFEPASGGEKQALVQTGDDPFIFTMPGKVEFAQTDPDKPKNKVRLNLYDGSIVKHWFFGNLAFEQKSMRMAKKRNPILFNHDVTQRIAISDSAVFEPDFVMEGDFLKTSELAQGIKSEMDEGFPFEASLRFDPDKSDRENIAEGNTVEVNGRKLKGPGTIIRNALILEGSICVFGALKNTKSQAFDNIIYKENNMAEESIQNMSLADLTAENLSTVLPEIHNQILAKGKTEGEQDVMRRFAELKKVCGEDNALLVKCFGESKNQQDALQMRAEKAEAQNKELADQLAKLKKGKVDPATQEFTDTTSMKGDNFDEKTANDEQLKEHFNKTQDLKDQFSSADSYIAAVRHPPKK